MQIDTNDLILREMVADFVMEVNAKCTGHFWFDIHDAESLLGRLAVPQLLETCKMVANVSNAKLDELTATQLVYLIIDLRNAARAAIAKAEGQQ